MRDTYADGDLQSEVMAKGLQAAKVGLRHSIRPRRKATDHDAAPAKLMPTPRPMRPAPAAATQPKPAPKPKAAPYVLEQSLPRWHDLPILQAGNRRKSKTAMPVVDAARDSASVRAFDQLRTRLRQTTLNKGWTNIAVASPTPGCGNTFTAVNLALSLSRVTNSRTVLMDFNLRKPDVAQAFDMTARGSMSDFLAGHTQIGDHLVRVSDTLALGLSDTPDPCSAETLQAEETAEALERMRASLQPDLVIYDMPAMLVQDDLAAFIPQLDGVLLVSDGTQTMSRQLLECERMLEGKVPLLGVVLNRARTNSIPRYA